MAGARMASDRVFGVIGGAMLLLALGFFVRSLMPGGSDTGAGPSAGVPRLQIVSPAADARVAQPAVVEFDAGAPLVLGPSGWTASGRHLHLFVGGTELMAASTEIRPVRGTRYAWSLPRLPAGATTLRMTWSDERHRSMAEGASRTVPIVIRRQGEAGRPPTPETNVLTQRPGAPSLLRFRSAPSRPFRRTGVSP